MPAKRIGIIGHGHLGQFLAEELHKLSSFEVVRIWNRTVKEGTLPLEKIDEKHLKDIDLVIEVAHPALVKKYADTILQHCDLFIGSPTCLADEELFSVVRDAAEGGRSVFVPAGAFWGGNDIQKMSEKGTLKALTITMTKLPASFKLESPLKEKNEEAKKEDKAVVLYEGPVRPLCPLAPNNVNTMAGAAIAASSLGFDGVVARLVADPKVGDWQVIEVVVEGPDGFCVETKIMNPAKPGVVTGPLTYYSFLASIKESQFKPAGGMHMC